MGTPSPAAQGTKQSEIDFVRESQPSIPAQLLLSGDAQCGCSAAEHLWGSCGWRLQCLGEELAFKLVGPGSLQQSFPLRHFSQLSVPA